MSSFYSGLATTAAALITDKGQVVSFSRETGGTFDSETGLTAGASTTVFTANAVALDYKNHEVDGAVIQIGDVKLICETTATEPAIDDVCTVDSVVHRVINVKPLKPSGVSVINTVQLRI